MIIYSHTHTTDIPSEESINQAFPGKLALLWQCHQLNTAAVQHKGEGAVVLLKPPVTGAQKIIFHWSVYGYRHITQTIIYIASNFYLVKFYTHVYYATHMDPMTFRLLVPVTQ